MDVVVAICLLLLPFLMAGMFRAVLLLEKKDKGLGPIPYCIAMGVALLLIWIGIS
ncbi:MAG TPA: hypothetical protein IAA94_07275 [Candidatus Galloscillospira stercoripullorum]|mgnify:CR=1 FL=1|nr:hypothetical protein [Candidatus Galloscillospira stercoripullorum]